MGRWHRLVILALSLLALLPAIPASAQSIDPPLWWTVDGGGVYAAAGVYTLGATTGQPDAATASGGYYQLRGGYWPGAIVRHPVQYVPVGVGYVAINRMVTYGQVTIIALALIAVAVWPKRNWNT
jgi:hypothetical protein